MKHIFIRLSFFMVLLLFFVHLGAPACDRNFCNVGSLTTIPSEVYCPGQRIDVILTYVNLAIEDIIFEALQGNTSVTLPPATCANNICELAFCTLERLRENLSISATVVTTDGECTIETHLSPTNDLSCTPLCAL